MTNLCFTKLFLWFRTGWIVLQVYFIGFVVSVIQLFKFASNSKLDPRRLAENNGTKKRLAIVTGASSGIGQAIAERLSKKNYTVIAPIHYYPEYVIGQVEYIQMDLGSLESVRSAASAIKQKHQQIDVLINCAGIMFAPFDCSEEGLEKHFVVNYLGHFLFTKLLMPLLLVSSSPKIINVTSSLHALGCCDIIETAVNPTYKIYSPYLSYANSKLALILFTYKLQRCYHSNLTAIAYDPGTVNTNLYESAHFITSWFVRNFGNFLLRSPPEIVEDITMLIDSNVTSQFNLYCGWMKRYQASSFLSQDVDLQDRLWDLSTKLTKAPS